jgi:hypothetical protein
VARAHERLALLGLAFASSALLGAPRALAQANDPCLTAPIDGQQQQRAGKLLEARASYLSCSRKSCPKVIVQDCEHWLGEVNDALPSVIFAARDAQEHDLFDVKVSIDGGATAAPSALGVPLDPGEHRFTFHREGAPDVQQRAILRAGEKNRQIVAVFAPPSAPPPVPLATDRPIPVAAWIVAGTGVAAFTFFGVFGALGVSERGSDGCATGCSTNDRSSINTKFDIADVGLVTGVVALGAAAWIYLARPTIAVVPKTGFIDFRPAPGGGVAVLGGRF